MPEADDRQLLLYIAAKVARLDAVTSSITAILHKDLQPEDEREAKQRRFALQWMYNKNIAAEREHLKTQFPSDYKALDEYIILGEGEHEAATLQGVLDVLEGKVPLPEAFRPPPEPPENDTDTQSR